MLFRAVKQIARITATIALLNKGEREKSLIIITEEKMRKILLMSSAFAVLGLSGTAEAACIQTPSCSSLGYSSTTACEGGLKCPWGNAWFCNVGGGSSTPDYSNCKIGDILYSDMSCNTNVVASKTPIGVIFDTTNGLAIAKDEFSGVIWGAVVEDVSGIQNYDSITAAPADWQGFKNTKAMYEADKSGETYQAAKLVLTYSTEGTSQGQWYLPAAGELKAIASNKDTLNTVLSKIGGTQMSSTHWSSSEQDETKSFFINMDGGSSVSTLPKIYKGKARPVINFASQDKINSNFAFAGEVNCKIGSILYSDKKCYLGGMLVGKTPIGIVFDNNNSKAIALEYKNAEKWTVSGYTDIPDLPNYTYDTYALQDYEGKSNTKAIIEYGNANKASYPAAMYVNNYATEGTKAGDWYLPSLGELNKIYSQKDFVNYGLSVVGKMNLGENYHWSSTEYGYSNVWILHMTGGNINDTDKQIGSNIVRPVLQF